MHSKIDLSDRVAVVTGGQVGIGRAIADCFRECNANVVIWDLNQEQLSQEQKHNRNALSLRVDVADRTSVNDAAKQTLDRFGRIDILVNNAGYGGPIAKLDEYPYDEWKRIMAVNLDGVFHCCNAVIEPMRENSWGRIVNISSLAGKEGTPGAGPYSISKAGVIALTKALGKENANTGILVNCIAPAAINTDMLSQFTKEHVQVMIDKSPMSRLGEVEEVAALTAWLASPDLSFSTGAVYDLSGGRATY